MRRSQKGFTLIELLIVVGIIAILATATFVALDPIKRFKDSRDARRWSDISEILNAIKVYQVDRGELTNLESLDADQNYMISNGSVASGCDLQNENCDLQVPDTDNCVNLASLISYGYLGTIPVSPNGSGSWSSSITGYVLTKTASGALKITACESENAVNGISVMR